MHSRLVFADISFDSKVVLFRSSSDKHGNFIAMVFGVIQEPFNFVDLLCDSRVVLF